MTAGMVAHALNACGRKTGMLSTTRHAPLSPFTVQAFLHRLAKEGRTHAVLAYGPRDMRECMDWTWPTVVGVADGNGNSGSRAVPGMFRHGTKVLDYDNPAYESYCDVPTKETIVYSRDIVPDDREPRFGPRTDLWLEGIHAKDAGSAATVRWKSTGPEKGWPLTLSIPGEPALKNALCAVGCIKGLPNPPAMDDIVAALATFTGIPAAPKSALGQPNSGADPT